MKHRHNLLSLLYAASLILSACATVLPTKLPEIDTPTTISPGITNVDFRSGYGVRAGRYELYFTDPSSPLALQATGGVDGPLVEALDSARLSIDVAAYSLGLNSVRNALLRAHDRGVTVRIVMETDNVDRSDPQILMKAGVPIVDDRLQGLMHDKFIVIDKSEVWLGSMNYTDSSTYEDNNNMIRIRSAKIAEDYLQEFEEMFSDNMFGPNVVAQTPNPTVTIDDTRIDVYFSPDDHVINALAALLSAAQESIYFLAFSFTSNELGDIVREKAQAGLTISGVMDREQVLTNQGTEFDPFRQAKLDVVIDGIEGQMHHKVFIVDDKIVALGSYNFSKSAEERNDENMIIVYNEDIAHEFMREFQRVWAQASE